MKLKAEQLASQLQKGLAPLYFICGDEPLLLQECADQVRQAARERGFADRQVFHVEAGFAWEEVLASANSLSLFAEQKLLDIRLQGKPNDKGMQTLLSYANSPPADTLLLLTAPKLDSSALKAKWATALEQAGVLVQIWPLDTQALPGWLSQRARQLGLQLSPDAAQLLAQRVEGNLLAAIQELNLLALLCEPGVLQAEQIEEVVAHHARHDVFDLCKQAFSGDWPATLRILRSLQLEETEPTLLLWALSRELRALLELSQVTRQGQSFDQACRQLKIWNQRQAPLRQALQRCRPNLLLALQKQIHYLDSYSKTGQHALFWQELQLWLSHLCGRPLPLPFAH